MAPVPGDSSKTPVWHVDAARGPSTPSFDHLVGAGEYRWWNVETKRLRGLEVDYQLVLGRRLHRQVARLLALEDAIDVAGSAHILIADVGSIGDQAASGHKESMEVNCGQFLLSSKRDEQITMQYGQYACRDNQASIMRARECRKGTLDLASVAHIYWS